MKHISGLDSLRAFAVFLVIITHWGPHKFKSAFVTFIFTNIIPNGMFGVDLFFVLSGYLITRILVTAREEASANERLHIIKNFYIRRILRIFPIYFLFIFGLYVFDYPYVRSNILYYLTYTSNFLTFKTGSWQGISHTWSLAVEEQFYLIWPWVIIYSPRKYLFSIIIAAVATGIVSSLILYYLYGPFFNVLLLPCITAFAIGALYAYIQTNTHFKKLVSNIFIVSLPICLILLLIYQSGHQLILINAVNALIAVNAIMYVEKKKHPKLVSYIINNRLLVKLGQISYGIYLYHNVLPYFYYQFIGFLQLHVKFSIYWKKILILPPSAYLIHLGLVLLIAILSYNYIEIAFLKMKKYFTYVPVKRIPESVFN